MLARVGFEPGPALGSFEHPRCRDRPPRSADKCNLLPLATCKMQVLTGLEKRILRGAAADLARLRAGKPIRGDDRTARPYGLREAIEDAKHGLVRLAASRWLGKTLDGAGRMAVSRAYQRLERRGLAERHSLHWAEERATHLKLTAAGIEAARSLKREKKEPADG